MKYFESNVHIYASFLHSKFNLDKCLQYRFIIDQQFERRQKKIANNHIFEILSTPNLLKNFMHTPHCELLHLTTERICRQNILTHLPAQEKRYVVQLNNAPKNVLGDNYFTI